MVQYNLLFKEGQPEQMAQDCIWVLNIPKNRDSTAPGVILNHHLTTLIVKKVFFRIVSMSCIFICPLLLFFILDSSEKGLTSSSLLSWVFIDMSESLPEASLLQAGQPSNVSHPSCARCSDPFTFVSFYLGPCSTCSCLSHTGRPRTGHSTQMCLTKAEWKDHPPGPPGSALPNAA